MRTIESAEKKSVLCIDDDIGALKLENTFERYNYQFIGTTDPINALGLVAEGKIDLILIDLRMYPLDGIELTKKIKDIHPNIPVVIFSAYLNDNFYENKVEKFNGFFADKFEKPFPVATSKIDKFFNTLKNIIEENEENLKIKNPFHMTFEEFLAHDDNTSEQIKLNAWRMKKDWFFQESKKYNWKWLIYCGDQILKASNVVSQFPSENEIENFGKEYNKIPFLFVAPPTIEEIGENESISKERNQVFDFYPTLPLTIHCSDDDIIDFVGDFDTGSNNTICSSDIISVSRLNPILESSHLNNSYKYSVKLVKLILKNQKAKRITHNLPIYIVLNWEKSPFVQLNPNRVALIGRDILRNIEMKVVIDTVKKKTYFDF